MAMPAFRWSKALYSPCAKMLYGCAALVGSPPGVVGLGFTGCEKTGVTATEPGVCSASSRGGVVGWVVALGVFSTAVGGAAVALSDVLGVAVGVLAWVAVGFGVLVAVAWLVGRAVTVAADSGVGPAVANGAVFVGMAGVFSTESVACGVGLAGIGVGCTSGVAGVSGSGVAAVAVATVGSVVAVPSSASGVVMAVGEAGVTSVGCSVGGVAVSVAAVLSLSLLSSSSF